MQSIVNRTRAFAMAILQFSRTIDVLSATRVYLRHLTAHTQSFSGSARTPIIDAMATQATLLDETAHQLQLSLATCQHRLSKTNDLLNRIDSYNALRDAEKESVRNN